MSDVFDRAQEAEEVFLRLALEEQRRKAGGATAQEKDWRVMSAEECEATDCGEPIPVARRRALPGVRMCVECQERFERLRK